MNEVLRTSILGEAHNGIAGFRSILQKAVDQT